MANIYQGGLPQDAGKNLSPSFSGDENMSQPNSGPSATPKTAGNPPTFSGGNTGNEFLSSSDYQPKDMQERAGSTPKVCNPDDLSYS